METGKEFLKRMYKELTNCEAETERIKELQRQVKKLCYDKYVIKLENIPEEYVKEKEQEIWNETVIRESKKNEINNFRHLPAEYIHKMHKHKKRFLSGEVERKILLIIIKKQKMELDRYIDYFSSDNSKQYPTWFKCYFLKNIVKFKSINEKTGKYKKRTNTTVEPFITINHKAISMTYEEIKKQLGKEKISEEELKEILKSEKFLEIYANNAKLIYADDLDFVNSLTKNNSKKESNDANIEFNEEEIEEYSDIGIDAEDLVLGNNVYAKDYIKGTLNEEDYKKYKIDKTKKKYLKAK